MTRISLAERVEIRTAVAMSGTYFPRGQMARLLDALENTERRLRVAAAQRNVLASEFGRCPSGSPADCNKPSIGYDEAECTACRLEWARQQTEVWMPPAKPEANKVRA